MQILNCLQNTSTECKDEKQQAEFLLSTMQKNSWHWGADRLGTSRIVKIVKNEEATGY